MAHKTNRTGSSFAPASDAEVAELLLRGKPKAVPQIAITHGDGGDLPAAAPIVEDHSSDDAPAAVPGANPETVPAAPVVPTVPAAPPAGPGTEHVEHKPVLSDEVEETRRRLRPEIGPRGESLDTDSSAALEAAIDKGQKDAAKKAVKEEADKKVKEEADKKVAEKPTEKPEGKTAPVEATPVPAPEEEIPDEEIIQFLKPKSQKKFIRYATENKELKAKVETLETEKKALAEKALAPEGDPKAKEELDALREKVMRYDRLFELDNDPALKTKFDEPVEQAEAAIMDLLKNYQLSEQSLATIKKAGGFAAFAHSDATLPVVIDGENQEMTSADLAKQWIKTMKVDDAALLQGKLDEQRRTREGKKAFVETEKANAKEYYAKRAAEAKKQDEAVAATSKKIKDDYDTWTTKTLKEDWLQDKPVPDKATDEEKKAITEHNEYTKQIRAMFTSINQIKTVQDFQELVLSAAQFHHVRRDAAEKDREIAHLKTELETVQAGLSTTGKSGSIRTGSVSRKEEIKAKKQDPRFVDSAAALEAAIEAGEKARLTGSEETE